MDFPGSPDSELPPPGAPFSEATPFSWELYRAYGAFPAVLDRHVTEFFPSICREGAYYGRTLGVDAFSFEGTIAAGDEVFAEMSAIARGEQALDPDLFSHSPGEHEQLVTILACLGGEARDVFSVNLPNGGRVPGVPDDAVLEGMVIGAYAIGARRGFIYVRDEYPLAVERVNFAIAQAGEFGLLGENILGSDFSFSVRVRQSASTGSI